MSVMSGVFESESYLFFLNHSGLADRNAEEITIRENTIEENLYSTATCPHEYYFNFADLCARCGFSYFERPYLEQFSFQKADKVIYHEDKIMSLYRDLRFAPEDLVQRISKPHPHFSINFFLSSKETEFKFYDLDISRYRLPEIPASLKLASAFGIGVDFNRNRRDVYLTGRSSLEAVHSFSLPEPDIKNLSLPEEPGDCLKLFGLSFDANTLKPLKLKRYYYPRDPALLNQELYTIEK